MTCRATAIGTRAAHLPTSAQSARANPPNRLLWIGSTDRNHPTAELHLAGTMNTRYSFYDTKKYDRKIACIVYAASVNGTPKSVT